MLSNEYLPDTILLNRHVRGRRIFRPQGCELPLLLAHNLYGLPVHLHRPSNRLFGTLPPHGLRRPLRPLHRPHGLP